MNNNNRRPEAWFTSLAASQRLSVAGWRPNGGPKAPAFWVVSHLSQGVQKCKIKIKMNSGSFMNREPP